MKDQFASLAAHRERLRRNSLLAMFDSDSARFEKFSLRLDDLLFDYSKNRIDADAIDALCDLARQCGVEERREEMFAGKAINTTEKRAVLHTALRGAPGVPVYVGGADVAPEIAAELARMRAFAGSVRSGAYTIGGAKVGHVVNIGIGGSDLGPAMAVRALAPYHDGPKVHFVSNIDGADLADTLHEVDLQTTLFIVASKTFTTAETMTNARSARHKIVQAVGEERANAHFAAISTNLEATRAFGISDERTFGFWDWVGGRYSIWSAIGLSLMLAIGADNFTRFLAGANTVDSHFRGTPIHRNIPVIMALLGIWHRNIWGFPTHAVLPYDNRLARFPAYLQQLDMESNGKSVRLNGEMADYETGPVVWGEPGTNGQHAFYQLLHQGTQVVPCDFLVAANAHEDMPPHHVMLVSNCLAQSAALMAGRSAEEALESMMAAGMDRREAQRLAPHRAFSGDRPSNTLLYSRLDPHTLGMLIALYEHKIFVQGVIWNINSFDQWGVELGKVLAKSIEPLLSGEDASGVVDGSTAGLAAGFKKFRSQF